MVQTNVDKRKAIISLGPGRSGSTYLYDCLRNAFGATELDVKEKNLLYKKSRERYKSEVLIDVSNTIYSHANIFDLVMDYKHEYPNTEFILLYRNPSKRLLSLYKYQIQVGLASDESVFWANFLDNESFFIHKNSDLLKLKELKLLKVVSFDELQKGSYEMELFGKKVKLISQDNFTNYAKQPRVKILMKFLRKFYIIFQIIFGKNAAHRIKRNKYLISLFYDGKSNEDFLCIPEHVKVLLKKERQFFEKIKVS